MRIYIGGDESYESKEGGVFVLNFTVLESEETLVYLCKVVEDLCNEYGYSEIKSKQINDKVKTKLLSRISKISFRNYYFTCRITSTKNILSYYKEGLKLFLEEFVVGKGVTKIEIKLDEISGDLFQGDCIKMARQALKKKQIKSEVVFVESEKHPIVQVADIFAGEIRKDLLGESNFGAYLSKTKTSIN
jgi:hypothetical protein